MSYKYIKVSLLAYLFLFVITIQVRAQNNPAWEKKSYLEIFKLELEPNLKTTSPEDAYISGYKIGLSNIINDVPEAPEALSQINAATSIINAASLPEVYQQYYLNDMLLLQALMELKIGNEVKFMWMMNQLYHRTETLAKNYPDFIPAKKLHALMLIMIASVPEQYQWIFSLLGFEGDSEEGLEVLQKINNTSSPLKYEGKALFYLITNYLQPELREANLEVFTEELNSEQDLYLLHFIAGLSYLKQHNSLKAREYFQHLTKEHDLPVAHYFLAETYLHEGKLEQSAVHYNRFLNTSNGENLIKDAYFKLFLISYMDGNIRELDKYRTLANRKGSARSEADKNADKFLKSQDLPHPVIFRIRFYTDGGFYNKALALVSENKNTAFPERDKIEMIYRKARLYHLTGNLSDAINGYKNTVALADERYFAPNSALQLGFLYEMEGEVSQAKYYFEKVLDFKDYTYENSIRSKAKSAIKNLNNN